VRTERECRADRKAFLLCRCVVMGKPTLAYGLERRGFESCRRHELLIVIVKRASDLVGRVTVNAEVTPRGAANKPSD
jgi:hypothetical protein